MVRADELTEGDYIIFETQLFHVLGLEEITNNSKPSVKITVELAEDSTSTREIVVPAENDIELGDPPGTETHAHRRHGVSAPSGVGDTACNWDKVVIPKTDEERASILARVNDNVFFELLDEAAQNELVDVVMPKTFAPGDTLMREGEEGDLFYILEEGEASIFVLDESGKEVKVRHCKQGDSFGELALMYNAPRNATVKAETPLKCWCMDRESFQFVIVRASIKKSDRYLGFVDKINVFSSMSKAEKMKLVEALIPRKVKRESVIVRQGDTGDMFYIVERGTLVVKQLNPEGSQEVVNDKHPGDYFGEISLMADMPRSATVVATEDCVLLTLDRKSFVSLLGPMEPMLRRNVSVYKTYVDYADV